MSQIEGWEEFFFINRFHLGRRYIKRFERLIFHWGVF